MNTTFAYYLEIVRDYFHNYRLPSQGAIRVGQAYWNCLPDKMVAAFTDLDDATRMRLDPYHNDCNLPNFLVWAQTNWGR